MATSICPSEAVKKHVAILKVVGRNSYLTPIPLETVRPMVLKTINATDYDEQLELYLDVEINPKVPNDQKKINFEGEKLKINILREIVISSNLRFNFFFNLLQKFQLIHVLIII